MDSYQEDTYGERVAGIYDEWYAKYDDAMIETLAELARGGHALELGIGTGRIALPLQLKGITVHGIDASPAMIAKLRSKPNGDKVQVILDNFADVAVEGQYDLIYVVFNTFFALLTQDEQIRCIGNVAQRLGPAGNFVVEAFMPDLSRFSGQQTLRVISIGEDEVRLDASQIDPIAQQVTSQHVTLTEQGVRLYPVKLRYVWPTELDLMARLAGLQLKNRWGNWQKSAFTVDSGKHISVYEHIQ
jgi:SAM-dependent methyltransferase